MQTTERKSGNNTLLLGPFTMRKKKKHICNKWPVFREQARFRSQNVVNAHLLQQKWLEIRCTT